MTTSVAARVQQRRIGFRMLFVAVVLSTAAALLTYYAFSPWQFDIKSAEEATRSKIPRVATGR